MKKFLVLLSLFFLWASNGYGLSCNLQADSLKEDHTWGHLEIDIYNPNSNKVFLYSIIYFNGNERVREYDIIKYVGSKSNLSFNHKTNESFLKRVNSVNFGCKIMQPTKSKPFKSKQKSGSQKILDKIIGN